MKNDQQYGINLSERVYEFLKQGSSISSSHYGYCGVGFVFDKNVIHYTHFDEWLTWRGGKRYELGGEYLGIIKSFATKQEFVGWLSIQSDHSLSGFKTGDDWYINNQRITKSRLERFLQGPHA